MKSSFHFIPEIRLTTLEFTCNILLQPKRQFCLNRFHPQTPLSFPQPLSPGSFKGLRYHMLRVQSSPYQSLTLKGPPWSQTYPKMSSLTLFQIETSYISILRPCFSLGSLLLRKVFFRSSFKSTHIQITIIPYLAAIWISQFLSLTFKIFLNRKGWKGFKVWDSSPSMVTRALDGNQDIQSPRKSYLCHLEE